MGRLLFGRASVVTGRAHAAEPHMSQPRAPERAFGPSPAFEFKELSS